MLNKLGSYTPTFKESNHDYSFDLLNVRINSSLLSVNLNIVQRTLLFLNIQ